MPTSKEIDELINNCMWQCVSYKGVKGYKVTSKKEGYTDKWIFLPAAGYRNGTSLSSVGSNGYYWSSSLNPGYPPNAYSLKFYLGNVSKDINGYRYSGRSVRPVSE